MTRYNNGVVLERAVKALLEDNGYLAVRAAGSHGIADVIGLKNGETLLVQCKLDGYVTPLERAALWLAAAAAGAVPLIAAWHKPGPAARTVQLRRILSSQGSPRDYKIWTPDHGLEEAPGG